MADIASSPLASSAEEYEDDSATIQDDQWQPKHEEISPSMESSTLSSDKHPKTTTQMQKRRRVTRACDECRRKKIKCDGKQPCTHCTVYSYECTYDQPSNRRRNPAPHYVETLENRLQRAETLLKTVLPDFNLDDPGLSAGVPQRMHLPAKLERQSPDRSLAEPGVSVEKALNYGDAKDESLLESMIESAGSLDLDDQGYWDFHGHSSGLVFLQRLRQQFGSLMGGLAQGQGNNAFAMARPLSQVFDSPKSSGGSPMDANLPNILDLPPKECSRQLCENALDDACALMRFVHQPTFYKSFDQLYDVLPENYGTKENRFLPLLYAVMALGYLFAKTEQSVLELNGYGCATDQGFQYFKASRQLMDVTDCRDLQSLQAILFMIMFLQSSARLSTCYSYIGIALRSSIRMGLHRSISINFNPVERETRRRIFWVVRKMDTYVGALLGLPKMLSDDDIDQEMPLEVDDEFITIDGILPMSSGRVPLMAAFNAHTQLVKTLAKTVKYIYPTKGLEDVRRKPHKSYVVSHAKIREIEQDLQEWMESLPMALRPGGEAPPELARVQQLLRMAYAYVQLCLYRPFLHYVSHSGRIKSTDKRSYACAAACVSVSRNIIHITGEMKKRGLLIGSYWFTMYTTFFAIISLVFFVLENPQSPTNRDILRDAMEGKDTLASLANRSMAADRCTITLASVFEQLPEKLKEGKLFLAAKKKRQAPSLHLGAQAPAMRIPFEKITQSVPSEIGSDNSQRARTLPAIIQTPAWRPLSSSHDSSTFRPDVNGALDTDLPLDAYTPSTSDHMDFHSPQSMSDSAISSNLTQPSSGINRNYGGTGHGLTDVSAMMFPSDDPFAYPNQPMTTLENSNLVKEENSYNPVGVNMYNTDANTQPNIPYGHNTDAQLFGSLPTYLLQGQPIGTDMPILNSPMAMTDAVVGGAMMNGNGDNEIWPPPQSRTDTAPGVGLDDIFAEDWNGGWMDQRYRQYG